MQNSNSVKTKGGLSDMSYDPTSRKLGIWSDGAVVDRVEMGLYALKSDTCWLLRKTSDVNVTISITSAYRNTILMIGNQNGNSESYIGVITKLNDSSVRIDKIAGGGNDIIITCSDNIITLTLPSNYYCATFLAAHDIS